MVPADFHRTIVEHRVYRPTVAVTQVLDFIIIFRLFAPPRKATLLVFASP